MRLEIDLKEIYNGDFYGFWDEMNEHLDAKEDEVSVSEEKKMTLASNLAITYLIKTFIGLDELSMMLKEVTVRSQS